MKKISEVYMKINTLNIKYIYNNKLLYPILVLFSILLSWYIVLCKGHYIVINEYLYKVILLMIGLVILNLSVLNIIKKEWKVEHIYLSIIIPVGLLYMTCIIPNFVPDEAAHAYRAYVVSDGYLITDRNKDKTPKMMVPERLLSSLSEVRNYNTFVNELSIRTDYSNLVEVNQDGTGASGYFFVGYIFAALGFFIGKIFGLNIMIAYYLARLFTFGVSTYIIYKSIKILPIGKMIALVYVLNPMFIQQGISISFDNMINSLSLLSIFFVIRKIILKEKITSKEFIMYSIINVLISLMKYAYFPLVFMSLLLVKNNKKDVKKIALLNVICIVLAVGVYLVSTKYFVSNNSYAIENGIDAIAQIKYIITHPLAYTKVIIRTTLEKADFYFFTMFGRNMGLFTINIPEMIPIMYFCVLLLSPYVEKNAKSLSRFEKVFMFIIFIMIYVLIETGLYLVWSKIGAEIIEGIQGRYFLPMFIILPMILINKKSEIVGKYITHTICMLLLFISISCLLTILKFFNY